MNQRPEQPPSESERSDIIRKAKEEVQLPSIFLIIVGCLGVLNSLLGMGNYLLASFVQTPQKEEITIGGEEYQEAQTDTQESPEEKKAYKIGEKIGRGVGLTLAVLGLFLAILVIYGGYKMKTLENRGLAMTASIISMIPCYWSCCGLGLPFGIWSLVILTRTNVKEAFQLHAENGISSGASPNQPRPGPEKETGPEASSDISRQEQDRDESNSSQFSNE